MSRPTWGWSAVDPRDPRAAGDDLPRSGVEVRHDPPDHQDQQQPQHPDHSRSLPAPDPERYGPVAPEPAWEGKPFNRERFLLWFLAAAMIGQYAFLMMGTLLCFNNGMYRQARGLPSLTPQQNEGCIRIGDRLTTVFELSVSTVLALLAGGTVALSKGRDDQRRRP